MNAESTCAKNKPFSMRMISDLGPVGLIIFVTGYCRSEIGLIRPFSGVIEVQLRRFDHGQIIPLTSLRAIIMVFKNSLCSLSRIPRFSLVTDRALQFSSCLVTDTEAPLGGGGQARKGAYTEASIDVKILGTESYLERLNEIK